MPLYDEVKQEVKDEKAKLEASKKDEFTRIESERSTFERVSQSAISAIEGMFTEVAAGVLGDKGDAGTGIEYFKTVGHGATVSLFFKHALATDYDAENWPEYSIVVDISMSLKASLSVTGTLSDKVDTSILVRDVVDPSFESSVRSILKNLLKVSLKFKEGLEALPKS